MQNSVFGESLRTLRYKSEVGILIDPRGTMRCFSGSNTVKKLKDRIYEYPFCGIIIDIDYNSTLNILKKE